ncbi:MAG TPA: primosomal protein N' [Tissierellia bacterium]|nr:primosomal protein N' [Tissierellia bacterium]
MYNLFVQVILNNNSKSTDQLYTYGVPHELESSVEEGKRVKVNFGRGKSNMEALIVGLTSTCHYPIEKIKPVIEIIDKRPVISKEMIKMIFWIRERYISKYSDAMRLMLPSDTDSAFDKHVYLNKEAQHLIRNTPKQQKIIEYLKTHPSASVKELMLNLDVSRAVIDNLIKKSVLIEKFVLDYTEKPVELTEPFPLNAEQKKVVDGILNSNKRAFLLHGVTGSGKTEVYMSLIEEYIKKNKQSIVLVPEISLTAQTIDRFEKRFGNKIALFHSKLSKREKFIQWNRVYNREADIVIGARSAIFAPIQELGVIVIDEEHEESYISSTSPKYDTREVAIKMAYMLGGKVVLGSATPSLSTYYMAMKGKIELLEMKNRVKDAQLPEMKIIDMSAELDKGNNTIISEELYSSIRKSLSSKEQTILFINKRGYSGFVTCTKCGHTLRCQRCDVAMTYHLKGNLFKCHYCGMTKRMIYTCPKCGSDKIEQFSAGTQHVEKLVKNLFPEYRVERMDFDSMTHKEDYEKIYNNFKEGKIDILIGTQMLAKGFDFPDVTTVGILSADAMLNLPFYNASEKTFQLITQVSGRAGRGNKRGCVFIQTYEPENFIINTAKDNNYELFLQQELKLRKEFAFPPFINIINICLISHDEELVNKTANEKYLEVKEAVKEMIKERSLLLYRPIPHNIYRVNNEYRINLYIKVSNHSLAELKKILRKVYMEKDIENIKVSININTDTI